VFCHYYGHFSSKETVGSLAVLTQQRFVDKNANYSDVGIYCFFIPRIMQQQIETIVLFVVALPKESKPSGVIVTVLTFLMAKKVLVLKLYLQSKICREKCQ
jgi:hypothetical protein